MAPNRVEHLEQAIKSFVESRSGFGNRTRKLRVIHKVFSEFDRDNTGEIDEEEFLAALVRMNIVGVTETALDLFDKFDEDMSGAISYQEFATNLFPGEFEEKDDAPTEADSRFRGDGKDVVLRVKTRILQLAGKNLGIRGVTRILRQMDADGSNSLNASELKEGLLQYGVPTSPSEIKTLMKHFDRDCSGKITIEEFLRGLRGDMCRPRRKLVRMAWDQLVSHLELDGPGDSVSLHELGTFYDVSQNPRVIDGSMSVEDALREFMSHWDKDGDDVVEWKEFLDYYKDISAGIENDDYFELMIRNAWHLSGGTGWAENTSNIRCLVTFLDGTQKVIGLENDFGVSRSVSKRELIGLLRAQGVNEVSDV
eukprot:CAMPEP_0203750374 /NCGR_PEP_ID=MMETSP0098-20131031/4605_1 /ASSEMBLY_ACC=CAM_ASM_000208 /TAXON_ID=96639 /ORGANISM=" , Strain NY0313808BC1" /LENGTH=366 /DNA_ID=CAMNT_0050639629 /DNA_START=557 /DNA_END=1654 /DNA_ORIENTATION=-